MIVLKEIKRKEYLHGTKALRVRHYFFAGMLMLTVAIGIPLYKSVLKDLPRKHEEKRQEEEAQIEKARQMFELKSILLEKKNHPDPHQRDTAN